MRLEAAWTFAAPDPVVVDRLAAALGLPRPVCAALANRGLEEPAEAAAFLRADAADLENPFAMAGMEAAVRRLKEARARKETVFVHGDRDVDGVTSTALLVSLLDALGIRRAWHVPPPDEGYGLQPASVDRAAAAGARLVLAVDCGVRDHEGAAAARAKGIDLVVLDHHEPGERLPEAVAVVDPKRADCGYPWKGLSACGVAFKFAQAVLLSEDPFFDRPVVVFDVETTGMAPGPAEIIEIGAVKAVHGVAVDRFRAFVRPAAGAVPAEITRITGIRWEDVEGAEPIEAVLPRFLEWVGDAPLVAHNAPFDMKFLEHFARALGRRVRNEVIDTLALARAAFPGQGHALGDLSAAFGIAHVDAHRALDDAEATLAVLKRIVGRRNPAAQAFLKANLDLLALSTLADVVPMRGENRVFVRWGMKAIAAGGRPGLAALCEAALRPAAGGGGPTPKDVAWSLVPILNAAGRMGRPEVAVEILLAPSAKKARPLVEEILEMHAARREQTAENYAAVVERLEAEFDPARDSIVVGEAVHKGVAGIVANRLIHDLGRPAVLYVVEGEWAVGTLRGVEGFDAVAALDACRDLLARYGGHAGAAGFTVATANLPAVREALARRAAETLPVERLGPTLEIDCVLGPADLSPTLLKALDLLAPFGPENEAPVFAARACRVRDARTVGDGKHLSLRLALGDAEVRAVGWNMAERIPAAGDSIDVAFTVEEDGWRGPGEIQWILEAWRPAEVAATA